MVNTAVLVNGRATYFCRPRGNFEHHLVAIVVFLGISDAHSGESVCRGCKGPGERTWAGRVRATRRKADLGQHGSVGRAGSLAQSMRRNEKIERMWRTSQRCRIAAPDEQEKRASRGGPVRAVKGPHCSDVAASTSFERKMTEKQLKTCDALCPPADPTDVNQRT
jgi:hypothetical protein